ncbi:MAG: tetratricopeptide repeat protein [Syntrophales bacterium]|nr:tetratricopeptide repeat protein [Syntrophales bacterium]
MKRYIYFIFIFFILLLAKVSNAQPLVYNCFNFLDAGDYQRALESGLTATKLYPRNLGAHYCVGLSYFKIGEIDKALYFMKDAEKYAVYKKDLLNVYNLIGLIYQKKGDLENALMYHYRELYICRELKDRKGEATTIANIAAILYEKDELDKALEYYKLSLILQYDEKTIATIYNNIALIYSKKSEYHKSIDYLKKAIAIDEKIGDYHSLGIHMLNIGNTYREIKDFQNALRNLNDGLEKIKKVGDRYWEAAAYTYLGWFYIDTKDIKAAKNYLFKAKEIFESIGSNDGTRSVLISLLVLEAGKKRNQYAGIEIGSKGVKSVVIELSESDQEGFYNTNEKFKRSINTTIISGVAETGMLKREAIEETALAVKELMNYIVEKEGITPNNIPIVGSSALNYAKNKEELAMRVKELTSQDMVFISANDEMFYNIIGSIPNKYKTKSLLIDIGSGNTKIGYLEINPQKTISLEFRYGTVSLAEFAKNASKSERNYPKTVFNLALKEIAQKIRKDSSRKPSLVNRQPVFMVGGIVWAMSTILYPERQQSFVKLSMDDINRFYNLVVEEKDNIFNIDLSKIKDSEIKKKAERELQSVKDVFTSDNLIAGATILKIIAKELKLRDKEIYFSRNGSWLLGYVELDGIQKFKGNN